MDETKHQVSAILNGEHPDPFGFLGMHRQPSKDGLGVRTFLPGASKVEVIASSTGKRVASLSLVDKEGFFAGTVKGRAKPFPYRLRVTREEQEYELEDPFRFGSALGELDLHLLGEGRHERAYQKMGSNFIEMDGIRGVLFSVWAPNARRVSVVGEFNNWDGRRHPMRLHPGSGIWELFVPELQENTRYKYEIIARSGERLPLKADPYARFCERSPGTASITYDLSGYTWNDQEWMAQRAEKSIRDAPAIYYEVHLGSWRRVPEEGNRYLTYRELAEQLPEYVADLGFTHIELLPVSEHPFDGSWGYQPIGLYAPTSRFGTPDDFRYFVDRCHQHGLGVVIDWVAAHFPEDVHGLVQFDGTALYEHEDPQKGRHKDWGTLIYNFGRREVTNFLLSNAIFWSEQYHIDGLRVDAVASMLYLDYSREPGEWTPNKYGGNENLEAVAFLKRMNELSYSREHGTVTVAEESTAWPMVSRPTYLGGLGFGYKWNMGWMHDTLNYISRDPIYRRYHHNELVFSLVYAYTENFVLPLSHDEVVHGKGSLINKMPGDHWQKFANLRLYLSYMFGHPGKKLLFMGGEFAQEREWNHDNSLDWHLLEDPYHLGVQRLVRDLNKLHTSNRALHELDCEPEGFEWIIAGDSEDSVVAFQRRGRTPDDFLVVVCNFTPIVRNNYHVGVPTGGQYSERLNTDASYYGGSDTGNAGRIEALDVSSHGLPYSLALTLPPLSALFLEPERLKKLEQ